MTPERMGWSNDERLYQPRIHSLRIRELHKISKETGEPMTVLVDQALDEFVERYRLREGDNGQESRNRPGNGGSHPAAGEQ